MEEIKLKEGATRQVYTLTPRKPQHKATDIHQPQNIDWFIRQTELIQPSSWAAVLSATGTHLPGISQEDARKRIASMIREQKLVLLKESSETPAAVNQPQTPQKNTYKRNVRAHGQRSSGSNTSTTEPANLGPAAADKPVPAPEPAASSQPEVTSSDPATSNGSEQGAQTVEQTETRGCPISMVTGEELLQLTDASLPGPMPLNWQRTFRSNNRNDIGIGTGWTHSLSEHVTTEGQHLLYHDSEGRSIRFTCPRLHQESRYIPEGITIEARAEGFLLKQHGQYDKLFTRVGHSTHYRLTELHHQAYQHPKNQGFKITLHHDANNALTRIDGNWGKSLVLSRDKLGHIRQIQLHNTRTQQSKTVAEYDYNEQRELIAQRNGSGVGEHYQFDNGQFIKRTLKTGFSYYYQWDDQNRCTRTWGDNGIYDYSFTWNPKDKHSIAIDSRGYTTHFYYNDYGQIIKKIDPEGGEHVYHYNNGSLSRYINPEGAEHATFYDDQKRPLGERDALNNRHSLSYFQGHCNTVTDKSGGVWRYRYNRQGLVESVIDPAGRTTDYQYTPEGLIQQTKTLTGTTRYQWNAQAELKTLTLPNGLQRHFQYNDWGEIITAETRLNNQSQGAITAFEYTDTGLISEVIPPDGKRISYTYNPNDQLIRHSDANGRITEFTYDGLDQVIERKDSEGHTLKYEYDTERNLTTLINENGERYHFHYDGNERLIKEIGFDGRVQHYKYGPAGHLIKHLDSGEVITTFERDALGQMTRKTSQKVGDNTQTETHRYLYDAAGRLIETYNDHQYLTFNYSKLGHLLSETHCDLNKQKQQLLNTRQTLRYDYHATDALKTLTLPNGEQIHYHLNEQQQLQQVNWNNQTVVQFERDTLGRERIRHQGSLTTHTDYDPMGRLQQQRAIHQNNKQNHPIHRQYQYDTYGNLSTLKNGPTETRYIYDLINRLEKVETQTNEQIQRETFAFDPANNLIQHDDNQQTLRQASQKLTKQSQGNRLAFQGDRKFTYDARGNLIKENRGKEGKLETRFEYNLQNQLTTVKKDGQTTHYTYDPLGRRIQKQDAFGTTHYLWAGDQLLQESRNNIQKTYVYEPGSFKPLAQIQDEQIYHYHLDHLGTPQELTNEAGKIVWKARYKTYGNLAVKEIDDIENNLRFQGQYFDEETGLHYNRHRYYNPNTGQFTQQDPIGLLGGINNYQYAPNPVQWVDPLGLTCKEQTPTEFAQSWQGSGDYPGVDDYRDITVKEGAVIYGGAPGQGNYYTTERALKRANYSAKTYFEGVQVSPHPEFGYRPGVTAYRVTKETPAAFGITKANPQHGKGGLPQIVIKNYEDVLEPLYSIPLAK